MRNRLIFLLCLSVFTAAHSLIVSIEGNCGAGKSTLAKMLIKEFDAPPHAEQWHKWINTALFQHFLQDKQRWAYTLSHFIASTRFYAYHQALQEYKDAPLIILDRSVYTQIYAFSRMFYDEGSMSELEWHLFLQQCKSSYTMLNYTIDAIVYVRTDSNVCFERIQTRKPYDEYLTRDYILNLGRYHERWLIEKELIPGFAQPPVLVLDGNKDFKNDPTEFKKIVLQVAEFLEKIATEKA